MDIFKEIWKNVYCETKQLKDLKMNANVQTSDPGIFKCSQFKDTMQNPNLKLCIHLKGLVESGDITLM